MGFYNGDYNILILKRDKSYLIW